MKILDEITELFESQGKNAYLGEPVSQKEHALQAAYLAQRDGAPESLIAAALLHDIGHLLHGLPENIADKGVDGCHEIAGEQYLMRAFGPPVAEPVRLHVTAKRYLCRTEPGYLAQLSPASMQSLALQGGPLNDAEVRDFERRPFHLDALRLRRWDDQAKMEGFSVPGVEHYRNILEANLL